MKLPSSGVLPMQFSVQQRSQTQAQPWLPCFPPAWDSSELEQTMVLKREITLININIIPWL